MGTQRGHLRVFPVNQLWKSAGPVHGKSIQVHARGRDIAGPNMLRQQSASPGRTNVTHRVEYDLRSAGCSHESPRGDL